MLQTISKTSWAYMFINIALYNFKFVYDNVNKYNIIQEAEISSTELRTL